MGAVRGWGGLCGALLLAAALTGCSASSSDTPGPRSSDTPGPREAATPVATNAAFGDAPRATATEVTDANFVSPSGNIGCYLDKSGARCDIVRKNWEPPPAPGDCDLDWGTGLSVYRAEKARFTCAGDTVLGGKDKLAYGKSLRAGDFTCSSDSRAMRCENTESGHGFTLAIEQYNLF
jgi:hypothetical protein